MLMYYQCELLCDYPGGFVHAEAGNGSVSCFNIFSGVFASSTLKAFSQCRNEGDILHLTGLLGTFYGDVLAEFSPSKGLLRL